MILFGYKLSWLFLLNFLFLQFLTLRLTQIFDLNGEKLLGYGLYYGILPFSGWWSNYFSLISSEEKLICFNKNLREFFK